MKTNFPKILSAFILFLTLCFSHAHVARANASLARSASANAAATGAAFVPTVSINNVTLNEGNSGTTGFIFTVTLSEASSEYVSVNFATVDGSATNSSDFQFTSGTISFAPGETSKIIIVLVNNDTVPEADETFTVVLSDAVNAVIANGNGTGTILNDDNAGNCTLSISPGSLNVGAAGSSGNTISVTTQPGCAFTAASSDSFITINSGANGSGNGTISFSVAANTGAARTGTIVVGGQTFTVNQSAPGSPGLRVSITDSPDPITFGTGESITYTIIVTNDAAAPATGVVLTNTLPAGVDFISVSTQVGSCSQSNRVVTCNLGSVVNTVTVTITARPNAPGTVTDTVSVSGNETDPNIDDNTATATTTVNSQPLATSADLRLTVFDTPSDSVTLGSGQNIIYSIFIDNDGPVTTATGIVVTSTLSANLDFVSASASGGGTCSFANRVVTCTIGTLVRGTSVIIIARPNAPGTASNTVSVRGNEPDSNPTNNSVTLTKTVNPPVNTAYADLRVTVFEPVNPVTFENTSFDIFVDNDGPSPATGVILTDTLPSNASFVSATTSQGNCTQANGVVTCNLGTVTGRVTISITVRPATAGTATNTVSVRANEPDFNTSNNSVTTRTAVGATKSRKRFRAF